MSNEQQNQGKEGKKIRKKFDENLNLFRGLLESRDKGILLKKSKVPNDKLDDVLDKIIEERYKKAVDGFMIRFNELLEEMMKYNKFIAQKKKEIEKLEESEMKKMNEKFQSLFGELEDINALRGEAAKALKGILGENQSEEDEDEDIEDRTE